MIKFTGEVKEQLIKLSKEKSVFLEGNILKLIDSAGDAELQAYVKEASEKDSEVRKKRLEMTKQVQDQNNELLKWKSENEKINEELKKALKEAEKSKEEALKSKDAAVNDLDLLQKRTQNQLIESIVKVSLWVVCGVGVVTTLLFTVTLVKGIENKIVESMWSNMFGILLTNSFSIIGTIMGVKYASSGEKGSSKKCRCNCKE